MLISPTSAGSRPASPGDGVLQDRPDCEYAHFDTDTDVDAADFLLWQGCMTGANILGEAHCAAAP